jgi:hypothetical protein
MDTVPTEQNPADNLSSVAVNGPVTIARQDEYPIFVVSCPKAQPKVPARQVVTQSL